MTDVTVERRGRIGIVSLNRPPHNFMDADLIAAVVSALHDLESDVAAAVLAAEGRNFCAGADVTKRGSSAYSRRGAHLYDLAAELYAQPLPLIAAVQGKAVGGGVGVALAADLRVGAPGASFRVNFAEIGIHPGFGLSVTLPALIGTSRAAEMFLTSRPVAAAEALEIGLLNRVADDPVAEAVAIAERIALTPPGAAASVRNTLRASLAAALPAAMDHERAEQDRLIARNLDGVP